MDLWTFLVFLGACLATSGGLVGLATVRIRRVAHEAGRSPGDGSAAVAAAAAASVLVAGAPRPVAGPQPGGLAASGTACARRG